MGHMGPLQLRSLDLPKSSDWESSCIAGSQLYRSKRHDGSGGGGGGGGGVKPRVTTFPEEKWISTGKRIITLSYPNCKAAVLFSRFLCLCSVVILALRGRSSRMPGASLWLIPAQPSDFTTIAQELISKTVPALYPHAKTYTFSPHVTLVSSIDGPASFADEPQAWLDRLPLSSLPVPVSIVMDKIEAGEPFFKKLTVRVQKRAALLRLASTCRAYYDHTDRDRDAVEQGYDDLTEGGTDAKAGAKAKVQVEDAAATWADAEYLPHLSLM